MFSNCGAGENSWEPLGYKIKLVNPKGNEPWIFIGRTDAEAPILWPPDAKSQLIGKDPDAGKDWRQEEKGATEDEMVGWHHWLNGHEFEKAPGNGKGQGSLVCCSPWGRKESDMMEQLNNNNLCVCVHVSVYRDRERDVRTERYLPKRVWWFSVVMVFLLSCLYLLELPATHHHHPKPMTHVRVHSRCCAVCRLGHMYNDMDPPLDHWCLWCTMSVWWSPKKI